ncbi:hypothetical protein [Spirochaeta dissipatitropha]
MVDPQEQEMQEKRLDDLRQKIQDELYVSAAIERLAELIARELLPDPEENLSAYSHSLFLQ